MNDFTDIVSKAMEVRPDEGDYTGKDGLLYCGKCHTPKEAYFEDGHGRDRCSAYSHRKLCQDPRGLCGIPQTIKIRLPVV